VEERKTYEAPVLVKHENLKEMTKNLSIISGMDGDKSWPSWPND